MPLRPVPQGTPAQISSIVLVLNNDKKELGHAINAGLNGTRKILDTYRERIITSPSISPTWTTGMTF